MLAPCRQAELPFLCSRAEDHRQLSPKSCLIPLLTQPAHGSDSDSDTRGQGWPRPAVQRPFPLSPGERELPALPGLQRDGSFAPGHRAGRRGGQAQACTHGEQAEMENQNRFQ